MPNLPARCQIMNSERKSFKSFITEEREAFKVEFQICQLLLFLDIFFMEYFAIALLVYRDLPTVHWVVG